VVPGGLLAGCGAGFMNVPRIKGSHNAMVSGIMAGEAVVAALAADEAGAELTAYPDALVSSAIAKDLKPVRNTKPLLSRFGTRLGVILGGIDMWLNTLLPFLRHTLSHGKRDDECLRPADQSQPIDYPKPDGALTFDKLSSVFLSATNHEEDQPCHLKVVDQKKLQDELDIYDGPSARYCPAGVYEWVDDGDEGNKRFVINAQNCVHCKTCDIKDPERNITWTTPEGGGGPNYPNM